MENYYPTHFNDDEGLQLTPSRCMNLVEVFRPPDSNFRIQSEQDRRKKGFYRYSDDNKHYTLITMDLLFDYISHQHNRESLKEIKAIWDLNEIKYNQRDNLHNNYLLGYYESDGIKEFFVTRFNMLPENTMFCYQNLIY